MAKQKPPHGGGLVGLFNSRSDRVTTYFINFLYYIRDAQKK